jgi:hypothetical protein
VVDVERSQVLQGAADVFFRDFAGREIFLKAPGDDFVVYVRKILHIPDVVALILQIAPYCVENHVKTGVSDVDVVVNRLAAGVHLYFAR